MTVSPQWVVEYWDSVTAWRKTTVIAAPDRKAAETMFASRFPARYSLISVTDSGGDEDG